MRVTPKEEPARGLPRLRSRMAKLRNPRAGAGEAEGALWNLEEKYRTLVRTMPTALMVVNLEKEILEVSQLTLEQHGFDRAEELLGKNAIMLVSAPDREKVETNIRNILTTGSVKNLECVMARRDGSAFIGELNIGLIRDGQGRPRGFIGISQDIAARRQVEEELKESEKKFKAIFENAQDGILLADQTSQKLYAGNKMISQMLGYSLGEIKTLGLMDIHRQEDLKYVIEQFEKFGKKEIPIAKDIPVKRKDGSIFYADISGSPIVLGGKSYLVGIFRDITERKRAEGELKKTLEDLKRSNQELEQFAYVASHDLQEPLRMISSYTQLLGKRYRDQLDDDARDFINFAVDGAKRMQKMINDLLAYSRVQTRGKAFGPTDTYSALGQALINLSQAIEDSHGIITYDQLPEVNADESQLVQLFQNLLSNAIKFQREKPPRVHISAEKKDKEWVFSVRDNGIGIDPKYYDRIFIIFQRLHGKGDYPGTGIGLALCKRIVERHGGRIWLQSEPAKGSTFIFSIPDKEEKNNDQSNDGQTG